jgi:hypothetical protein
VDRGREECGFAFVGEEEEALFLRKQLSWIEKVTLFSVGETVFLAIV